MKNYTKRLVNFILSMIVCSKAMRSTNLRMLTGARLRRLVTPEKLAKLS